jgi:hypothetical protein
MRASAWANRNGDSVLQAGETEKIDVNKPERDAIAQVLGRLAVHLNEFERSQLQSLLDKID